MSDSRNFIYLYKQPENVVLLIRIDSAIENTDLSKILLFLYGTEKSGNLTATFE